MDICKKVSNISISQYADDFVMYKVVEESFGSVVDNINMNLELVVELLNDMAGTSWGVHPTHLRCLYISLIRSRLDYGSFLYGSCANSHLNKLDIVQNRALRICGGFIRSTPIHVMQNELCLPPLSVRRQFLASRYWLRVGSVSSDETIELLQQLSGQCELSYWTNKAKPMLVAVNNFFREVDMHRAPILDMYTIGIWVSYIDIQACVKCFVDSVSKPKRSVPIDCLKNNVIQMMVQEYDGFYKLFTDGSKSMGVGAAFFDPQLNISKQFNLDSRICIMRAELIAIYEALLYAQTIEKSKVVILSDSRSALQHLAQCVSGSRGMPVAYDVIKLIYFLQCNHTQIVLQWIPSHVGVAGNEQADRLASLAVTGGIDRVSKPYGTELVQLAKEECVSKWQELFSAASLTKGIWYGTMQNKVFKVPWFDCAGLSRGLLVSALRVRSGHIPLNCFLHLMKVVQSPLCMGCDKTEDLIHFLVECDQNKEIRVRNSSLRDMLWACHHGFIDLDSPAAVTSSQSAGTSVEDYGLHATRLEEVLERFWKVEEPPSKPAVHPDHMECESCTFPLLNVCLTANT
ncbi:uncharacterized protein [Choristoneura fumiferana]|uniref:uncharacterized protein n=1 Tax=Choristoneura fumiferana TaxID=7141 RepID=UPI003D1593DB